MDESARGSQNGSEEEEPLIPDVIDEEFFVGLITKIAELVKFTRIKLDNPVNADNIQRLLLICNKYKSDLVIEELKCDELVQKLEDSRLTLENTEKLWKLDKDTMEELRGIIESAWKQKDSAQAREQEAQEELYKLRNKVEQMESTIQRLGERKTGGDEQSKTRDAENKEREKLRNDIKDLNKKIKIQHLYSSEVESVSKALEEKNKSLILILDETSTELFRDKKKVEHLTKELAEVKLEDDRSEEKIRKLQIQNERLMKIHVQHSLQILATKTNLDQAKTLQNSTNNKLQKALVEIEFSTQEKEKLCMDIIQKNNSLKVKDEEDLKLRKENKKISRQKDSLTRKITILSRSKSKVEEDVMRLRTHANALERELIAEKNALDKLKKEIDQITCQRDHTKQELFASKKNTEKYIEKCEVLLQEIRSLNDSIKNNELKETKLNSEIGQKDLTIIKHENHVAELSRKIYSLEFQLRLRENIITDLQKSIAEVQIKTVNLQAQLDLAQNERNAIQRSIVQVTAEKDEAKNEIQELKIQIDDLKEKIETKNSEITNLKIQVDRLEKERTTLKTEIKNMRVVYQHSRSELIEKRMENDRLFNVVVDNNKKHSKTKKQFDNIVHKRNLVSSELTKVNSNVKEFQERLDRTQKSLNQCEKSYAESLDSIRIMRIEIKNLQTERDVLKRDRECAADLRTELLQIHRELNQERIKSRALQDEMLNPLNIHRWRTLGGKDPEKMELITRIQTLQKQVLSQNVTAVARDKSLQESQNLYSTVKQFMIKLPSYKIKEQLNEVKDQSKKKDKKLKALIAELNVKELDEKSKDLVVDELKQNLSKFKKELTQEKKKKMKLLEERQIIAQMQLQCFSAPVTRVFGGGYKIPYGMATNLNFN